MSLYNEYMFIYTLVDVYSEYFHRADFDFSQSPSEKRLFTTEVMLPIFVTLLTVNPSSDMPQPPPGKCEYTHAAC